MPDLILQINPESENFLNQYKGKQLTLGQQSFIDNVKGIYKSLSELKNQASFEFTANNEYEIGRGNFYAITPFLRENSQGAISLEKLQIAIEDELKVDNKETLSFILLCLVEPVWLPGYLPTLPCSLLTSPLYFCSNRDPSETLKAFTRDKHILFQLKLSITEVAEESTFSGNVIIQFTIDNSPTQQVKLLPIHMVLNFSDENKSNAFQQELHKEFNTWLLSQDELAKTKTKLQQFTLIILDRCLFPILFGLLISAIAMVSFTLLNLSVISVFLLPPLGLAFGLIIASLASSGPYLIRKKQMKKLQRPIYLFNEKPLTDSLTPTVQTTSFFVPERPNSTAPESVRSHQP